MTCYRLFVRCQSQEYLPSPGCWHFLWYDYKCFIALGTAFMFVILVSHKVDIFGIIVSKEMLC